jgi:hypothetical protein
MPDSNARPRRNVSDASISIQCARLRRPLLVPITGTKYHARNHQSSIGDDSAAPIAEQPRALLIPSLRHSIVTQTPLFAGV